MQHPREPLDDFSARIAAVERALGELTRIESNNGKAITRLLQQLAETQTRTTKQQLAMMSTLLTAKNFGSREQVEAEVHALAERIFKEDIFDA